MMKSLEDPEQAPGRRPRRGSGTVALKERTWGRSRKSLKKMVSKVRKK